MGLGSIKVFTMMRSTIDLVGDLAVEAHNTSQVRVAARLHISTEYLSDILNGRRELSAKVAYKLGYKPVCMWVKHHPLKDLE